MHERDVPGGSDDDAQSLLGAADEGPVFFLSYAHTPRMGRSDKKNPWVGDLYDDLCEHVQEMAELPPGVSAGFMDLDLRQGQEWPDRLTAALANCRVFVPLYSKRYFMSEQCGKEWFAFDRRRLNHKAKNAKPVDTIVPALWLPVSDGMLPEAATAVQYSSAEFGNLYAEHGFYGIMKVSRWREAYEEAVYHLARRIVAVAEAAAPATQPFPAGGQASPPTAYELLPSAFGGAYATGPGDKPLRLTVVAPIMDELPDGRNSAYYGKDVRSWNPYREESARPMAEHAAELARSLSFTPRVGDIFQHEAGLLGSEPPSGPELLLLDPWAAMLPDCGEILRRLDAVDNPWVQVIVVWNQQDAEMCSPAERERLSAVLKEMLPRKLREGRATAALAVRGVPSLEEFGKVLPLVVAEAGRHYLRKVSEPQVPQQRGEAGRLSNGRQ